MEMSAPRTRDEETEWFGEGGTNDADYEPQDSDEDFDLTDDEQEVDQWA